MVKNNKVDDDNRMLIGHFKVRDGYVGTIEYDCETGIIYGHVIDIDEIIEYSGYNIRSAYNNYLIAVDNYVIRKGEREMVGTVSKTKEELLKEELELKNNEVKDLKEELKRLEKYKQYDDMADEMKGMQDSFVRAGFSEDQAFMMLMKMVETAAVMARKPILF